MLWEEAYNADQPGDPQDGVDQYAEWVEEGRPGMDVVEAKFLPSKAFVGSKLGWTFKTDLSGTGYYRAGVQVLKLHKAISPM